MKSFHAIICLSTLFGSFSSSGVAVDSLEEANLFSMELSLPIADGKKVLVNRVFGSDLGDGAFSWTGELAGPELGFACFSRVGDSISGTVHMSRGDAHVFRGQVDKLNARLVTPRTRSCASCRVIGTPLLDPRRQRRIKTWRNGDGNLVDLLVVYPAAVATDAGGVSLLEADVIKAVADANLCYHNSEVNLQLRLVHFSEVNYNQTGNLETDLERLENPNDGYMDNVHDLRDQYGADLVAMLATESSSGGLANTMMYPSLDFASQGFSVSVWDQIGAPSYTLAHELGHNMGCLHNREDSSGVDDGYEFRAFSYGKRWLSGNPGYATVMSYDTEPTSTFPNTIPFFSNPDVFYLGTGTGNVGSEDNAQVLKFTSPYVANFRSAVVQAIVPSLLSVAIQEGNSTSLGVRLAVKPSSPLAVNISLVAGGDADLMITSPSSMTFDSTNWNLPHPLQISALLDSDVVNGSATINFSASGVNSTTVLATEVDSGNTTTISHLIAGVSTNSLGSGISGVALTFSNGGGSVVTDVNGTFRHQVAEGWSGIMTPSKIGHTFLPATTSVTSLSGDLVAHNFIASRSSILYVDVDASGAGDGSSWANAYTDLAVALRSTHPFSEVWVAEGIYKPGRVRPSAFLLPSDIPVYGGFTGTETSLIQRDHSANLTILSGEIGDPDVSGDNCYHVVIPTTNATLDGFTISNGNASENYSDDRGKGGAIWAEYSAFTIKNCVFSSNVANQKGGAIFLNESNATLENCTFNGNTTGSTGDGGAVDLNSSTLALTACSFVSNHSYFYGGAINSLNSNITLNSSSFATNQSLNSNGGGAIRLKGGSISGSFNSFTANKATHEGGAILWEETTGSLSDSNFTANQNLSWNGGGGIYFKNASPTILRCSFTGNITNAINYGGAIHLNNASPTILNCVLTSNSATSNSGGAISIDSTSLPVLSANEFRYNSANDYGGAIYVSGGQNLQATNNLFLGNYSNSGGAVSAWGTTGMTFTNCRFIGNEANGSSSSSGGMAMLVNGTTSTSFFNCVISGNKANDQSGVLKADGTTRFVNCSLAGNSADYGGLAILFPGDSVSFENSILWGNTSTTSGSDVFVNSQTATASHSLFDPSKSNGTLSGSGNLSSNPLFMDADGPDNLAGTEDDDLTLQSSSPAINQASSSVSGYSITDLLGKDRSGAPDIGAYEYRINAAPIFAQGDTAALSILEDSNASFTYSATDPDADTLTWSMLSPASNGIASVVGSSGVTSYVPNADWHGSDSFVVQVSDGVLTDEITVSVTVSSVADSPAITQGAGPLALTMSEDGTPTAWLAPTLGGTDTDTAAGSLTWSVKTAASNGTATVSGTGSAPVTFTYAPKGNWSGSESFVVQLSDGVLTDEITVNVTVSAVNDAPAITQGNGPLTVTMSEDGAPTVWVAPTLGGTDTDTATGSLTWSVKTAASNGTATVSGTGSAPVTFTYAPTENWSGSDSFVVQVSDGDLMDEITVNVTVIPVNDSPRITNALSNGDLVTSIPENNASVLTLTATDVESDSLAFSISGVDSSSFDLNVTTGALSFKAAPDFENPDDANNDNVYELLVAVADGNTTSSSISLFVTVSDVIESSPQVLLAVTIEGNGTVTGSGSFEKDSNATLTATPALGYVFSQWSGDLNETANPLTLVMAGPRSVNAVFKLAPDSWMLALDEGNGWLSFSWFGNYYETNIGWLYHEYHGWLYRVSESTNSVWLYDTQLGWLWTSSNTYPYLYQANPGGWLYYDNTSKSPRRFYRYSTKVWEESSEGE